MSLLHEKTTYNRNMCLFLNIEGLLIQLLFALCSVEAASPNLQYVVPLDDHVRKNWTAAHNYYRRLVDSPEAANMRIMTWDDGLEALAKDVVSTCDFAHTSPEKLATKFFPEVGENLYTGNRLPTTEMAGIKGVTEAWYKENADYNYESRTCQKGKMCGHYTQVVWANTYKVGCAIANCKAVKGGIAPFLVSCNYGPAGNVYDYSTPRAPYVSGKACSQCDDGDVCLDQLCTNTSRDQALSKSSAGSGVASTHGRCNALSQVLIAFVVTKIISAKHLL